jgi:hypothetical protein
MSDETPPSPLRLRPRPRPESDPAPEAGVEGETAKLRLKPKLAPDPEPEVASEAQDVEVEAPVETPRLKPRLNLEPDPEPVAEEEVAAEQPLETDQPAEEVVEEEPPPPPMPEEGKVKLKIKLPGAVSPEAGAAEEEPPSLPPFPVVAPPAEEEPIEEPPVLADATPVPAPGRLLTVPPFGGSRPAVFKRPRVPAALLAAERRKRIWKYVAIAVGGVVLAGLVIGGAVMKLTPPPPTRVPPKPAFVPPIEPTVKPVVVEKPPAAVVELPPVESGERVASTATIELAPGVTATTESIKAVPNASLQFRSFVASAKISGVYQGNNPRAFINGRMVRAGEMIDDALEIHFDSVDAASRSIVFKDSTGATVSRRY